MQGVYLVYELTDPTNASSRAINILNRFFFTNEKEYTRQDVNIKYNKDQLYEHPDFSNRAIGVVHYDASSQPTFIEPWVVPPKAIEESGASTDEINATKQVWLNAIKNKAPYFMSHYAIVINTHPIHTHNDDTYSIPLYSKIIANENESYIIYATQQGDAFLVLEFQNNRLKTIHHRDLNVSQQILSYPIFTPYTFNEFNAVYSFRFKMEPFNKTLHIYSPKKNIPYTNHVCLIKPILQIRGFCYYHAVLHGLLIPPNFQWICAYKLLEYMKNLEKEPDNDYNLERFMNIDICEDYKGASHELLESTRYFVMKFFYQYLFHYETIASLIDRNQQNIDYQFIVPDTRIRHPHPIEILVKQTKYSQFDIPLDKLYEGGSSYEILIRLLTQVMRLDIRLSDKNSFIYTPETITYDYDARTRTFSSKNIVPFTRPGYTLEIGLIGIDYYVKKETSHIQTTSGHAIIGISCAGKKYILDSYSGSMEECDWTTINGLLKNAFIKSYLNAIEKRKYHTIKVITVMYCFIYDNMKEKQAHPNPREEIKRRFIYPGVIKTILDSNLDASIKRKITYDKGDSGNVKEYERQYPDTWMLPTRRGGARLETLTVKELQARCAKRKLAYSGLRKAELVALLRR